MPTWLAQVWPQLATDPVLLYSLAAALLLAVVSCYSGFGRLDWLSLTSPRNLLRVLGAIALAFVLVAAAEYWQRSGGGPQAATLIAGLARFPLYLVALAYGPSTGLAVAALYAGFAASSLLPGERELVLGLELVVLGWLAIYPSPRSSRWAGPLNALLAYSLAWGTAGIAVLAANHGDISFALVAEQNAAAVPGLLLTALLLAAVGPAAYARAFPHSRIDPVRFPVRVDAAEPVGQLSLAGRNPKLTQADARTFATLVREDPPHGHQVLTFPDIPVVRLRARPVRSLEPYSLPDDELG